jgi:hypothetical protein
LDGGDNMLIGFVKEKQEEAFDDWVKLLKTAKAEEEFLTDPKAVWLEAWTQATMIAWSIMDDNVPPEYRTKIHEIIKNRMLK